METNTATNILENAPVDRIPCRHAYSDCIACWYMQNTLVSKCWISVEIEY